MPDTNNEDVLKQVDEAAQHIISMRKHPMLVMYYPGAHGRIEEADVKDIYDEFRRRGWSRKDAKRSLDVFIHTYGGSPVASYRIAQVIRDFASSVAFLVPEYAYSGGTLTCLSGNEIRLGAYATLSPIDITVGIEAKGGLQLVNIDYFMAFAKDCRMQLEQMFKDNRFECETDVESQLLVEMISQAGALNVGRFFRERTLTGHYADRLINDYMLLGHLNKEHLSAQIIRKLLFEMPSHSFDMDYHICKEIKLPVQEMDEQESDMTKNLVTILDGLTRTQTICRDLGEDYKMPFFRLYDWHEGEKGDGNGNNSKKT